MVHLDQAQALLNAAARDTRRRLRQHGDRAPRKVQRALTYLEEYLFDLDLNVQRLKRVCGIRDDSLDNYFRTHLRITPGRYIRDCRFETAGKLLRDTDLTVTRVSELVGYSKLETFSRSFACWAGLRPRPFRERSRQQGRARSKPSSEMLSAENLRLACLGALERPALRAMIDSLEDFYLTASGQHVGPLAGGTALSEAALRTENETFGSRRTDGQDGWRGAGTGLALPAVVLQLLAMSWKESSKNPDLGVRLAESAMNLVYAAESCLDALLVSNLKARGWAWLGNARRLCGDLEGAERALAAASGQLPVRDRDRQVVGEIYHLEAVLRWVERQPREALALTNRAITLLRSTGDSLILCEALILRARLLEHGGDSRAGLSDLLEASQLVGLERDSERALRVHYNLSSVYMRLRCFAEALKSLSAAKRLCDELEDASVWHHLQWLEGLIAQRQGKLGRAESRLRAARQGFMDLQEREHQAALSLSLAILSSHRGRRAEAAGWARKALATLSELGAQREAPRARELFSWAATVAGGRSDADSESTALEGGSETLLLDQLLGPCCRVSAGRLGSGALAKERS